MSNKNRTGFRIDWELHELGPRPTPESPPETYREVSSQLDFSRLDYARAVAAGYVPANERRFEHEAA